MLLQEVTAQTKDGNLESVECRYARDSRGILPTWFLQKYDLLHEMVALAQERHPDWTESEAIRNSCQRLLSDKPDIDTVEDMYVCINRLVAKSPLYKKLASYLGVMFQQTTMGHTTHDC